MRRQTPARHARPACPGWVRTGRSYRRGQAWPDIRRGLLTAAAVLLAVPAIPAQPADAQLYYTRQPEMRIPFARDATNRLKQVQLYASTDQGRDWRLVQTAPPDAGFFPPYTAAADLRYTMPRKLSGV